MIRFDKPAILDGFYLKQELAQAGVTLNSKDILVEDESLFLDIAKKDESKAATVIANHVGDTIYPKTVTE